MIEYFNNYIKSSDNEIFSYCVYKNYDINIKIGQGADGFFIKSNTLDMFLKYYNSIKEEDYVNYHDDFYISYYFYLINKDIEYIKPPNNFLIYDDQHNVNIDPLSYLKGKYSRENLNNKISQLLDKINNNGGFDFLKCNK